MKNYKSLLLLFLFVISISTAARAAGICRQSFWRAGSSRRRLFGQRCLSGDFKRRANANLRQLQLLRLVEHGKRCARSRQRAGAV